MHQWYRVNNHMITDTHQVTIYNDKTVHMIQIPLAGPNKTEAIETFAMLSIQNNPTKVNQPTNAQPMTHSHNSNTNSTLLPVNLTLFYNSST